MRGRLTASDTSITLSCESYIIYNNRSALEGLLAARPLEGDDPLSAQLCSFPTDQHAKPHKVGNVANRICLKEVAWIRGETGMKRYRCVFTKNGCASFVPNFARFRPGFNSLRNRIGSAFHAEGLAER